MIYLLNILVIVYHNKSIIEELRKATNTHDKLDNNSCKFSEICSWIVYKVCNLSVGM